MLINSHVSQWELVRVALSSVASVSVQFCRLALSMRAPVKLTACNEHEASEALRRSAPLRSVYRS